MERAERLGNKESGVGAYWSELQNRCTIQEQRKEEAEHVSPGESVPALLMGPAARITWVVRIPHCQELESPHPRGHLPQALVPPSLPQAGCRELQAPP